MSEECSKPTQPLTKRERVEGTLRVSPPEIADMSAAEIQKLVHELQVHQIELKIQNEELLAAQTELAHSRDRFNDLYDFAPVGYLTTNPEGTILEANLTAAKMLGVERRNLVGRKFANFVTSAGQDTLYLHLQAALSGEAKQTCDVLLRRANGAPFSARLETIVSQDPATRARHCRTAISDITVHKQAEEELRLNAERLRQGVRVGHLGLFEHDHRTDEIYYSPILREIVGWSQSEPVTLDQITNSVLPEDRAAFTAVVQRAHDPTGDGLFFTEHRILRPDGTIRWVSARSQTTFEGEGPRRRPRRTIGALADITERKLAEEKLAGRERRFRALTEKAAEDVILLDAQGRIIYESPHEVPLLGYAPGELTGHSGLELVHPDDLTRARETLAGLLREDGSSARGELRMRRKAGGWSWIHFYASNLLQEPAVGALVFNLHNITERKQAEAALRESETKYRRLHESITDAFVVAGMNGLIQECNHAYSEMLGYTQAELQQLTSADLTPEPWHAMEARIVNEQVLRCGHSEIYQKEYRRKDGTVFPVELRTLLIRDDAGEPAAMWAIVRDITERKQAESALRYHLNLIQSITENTVAAIFVTDAQGRITFTNAEAERMFGYTRAELMNQVLHDRLHHHHPDGRSFPRNECALAKTFASGATVRGHEDIFFRKDGKPINVSCSSAPLEANGRWVGTVDVIHDITARIEAEIALRRARDELEQRVAERTAELTAANKLLTIEIGERSKAERAVRRQAELLDMASDAIFIRELEGPIRYWNRKAERLYGFSAEEAKIRSAQELLTTVFPETLQALNATLFKEGFWKGELTHTTKTGSRVIVESYQQLVKQADGTEIVLVTNHDLTERIRLHEEIVAAGERERERIGQNLHDGLCQVLTAARLKTDSLLTRMADQEPANLRSLKSVAALIVQAVDEAQGLARGLEPVEPLPEGLMSALQHLAVSTSRLFNANCVCEFPRPVLVADHMVATELFRIAQEATNNAIRHGHAANIRIRLVAEAGGATLTVNSDGKPFPKRQRAVGMGLKTMRFRAGRIGATLEVQRGARKGTLVRCVLPALAATAEPPDVLTPQPTPLRERRESQLLSPKERTPP